MIKLILLFLLLLPSLLFAQDEFRNVWECFESGDCKLISVPAQDFNIWQQQSLWPECKDGCISDGFGNPYLLRQEARMSLAVVAGGVPAVAAGCTTPTGDEFTESFGDSSAAECWSGLGGTTCNVTWTVGTGTPTISDISSLSPPANTACTYAVGFDSSSAAVNIKRDLGLDIANNVALTINFTVYINTTVIGQYLENTIISLVPSTAMVSTTNYFMLKLVRSTSGTGVATKLRAYGGTDTCDLDFAEDTWYDITIELDSAGGADASTMTIGGTSCNFTRGTTASDNLFIGNAAGDATHTVIGYIGNIRISTP